MKIDDDFFESLDTAKKLVVQAENILVGSHFPESWVDDLRDIQWAIEDYIEQFTIGFGEDEC